MINYNFLGSETPLANVENQRLLLLSHGGIALKARLRAIDYRDDSTDT